MYKLSIIFNNKFHKKKHKRKCKDFLAGEMRNLVIKLFVFGIRTYLIMGYSLKNETNSSNNTKSLYRYS